MKRHKQIKETDSDLMPTRKPISPELQKRIERGRAAAHQRIIDRGMVAFRADADMMDLLLQVSDYKRIPYGVLARTWVMDCLRKEVQNMAAEKRRA
jgi:hypothetical protein